jgi:uncharacterized protein YdhG (YjbR/CyaY superfamily)
MRELILWEKVGTERYIIVFTPKSSENLLRKLSNLIKQIFPNLSKKCSMNIPCWIEDSHFQISGIATYLLDDNS